MALRFEWDPQKALVNLRKHGVSFDEASTVFCDPLAFIFVDEDHSGAEEREIAVGHSVIGRLLLVSFVERSEHLIRVISSRLATAHERGDYEEHQRSCSG